MTDEQRQKINDEDYGVEMIQIPRRFWDEAIIPFI